LQIIGRRETAVSTFLCEALEYRPELAFVLMSGGLTYERRAFRESRGDRTN